MADKKRDHSDCKMTIMAVHDTMDILSGKWKISIIASLCYGKKKRYSEILRDVNGISGKMLSRELKDLEINQLIRRTVMNTQPVSVLYEITEYGQKLKSIIDSLAEWGKGHRKVILGK